MNSNYVLLAVIVYLLVSDIIDFLRLRKLEKRVAVLEKKTEDITVAE